jgi:glycosyltransferase involved in cell wall biosynthesis
MISNPRRISVVVPTRDRPTLVRQALASIRAHEGPLYSFEILVADNGTTPETPLVAEAFGATYIKVDQPGAGAARNAGLRAATGEYVAFLDDDDVWLPSHLGKHFEALDADPKIEAVLGQVIYTDPDLQPLGVPFPGAAPPSGVELLKKLLGDYLPQIGTLVARACILTSIGKFDESLLGGQDMEWLLRIARRRTMGFVAVPSLLFRGRPYQTYDALQIQRIYFARRVFLRHALPEWRLWRSPASFLRSYTARLWHFYQYFVDAAVTRSEAGDRAGAMQAIFGAFRVFPLRATYHMVAPKPLRRAALAILTSSWRGQTRPAAKEDIL